MATSTWRELCRILSIDISKRHYWFSLETNLPHPGNSIKPRNTDEKIKEKYNNENDTKSLVIVGENEERIHM